ncbi:S-adenosyl-L-methionine-dependent methyltransferase [Lipomyces kononenkoae]
MRGVSTSSTFSVGDIFTFWPIQQFRILKPGIPLFQNRPMTTRTNWTSTIHQHDPRWTAVDAYAFSHSHPASQPNAKALENARMASMAAGLPDIALSPAQGKFLALHCRASAVTHALEVGTLGGYSAIWVASENPQLRLTTIEYNPKHVAVARKNIELAGLSDRIEVIQGAGIDVLASLRDEVVAGTRPQFGFVFIDADKENNWNYFKLAKDMVKSNSVICVDNVVRGGRLADLGNTEPYVVASREVVENAGKEPGVDSVVIQTVGEKSYDGWLWAVVS